MRLDMFLAQKKNIFSRSRAQLLIKDGSVFVNGACIKKASFLVNETDCIELKNPLRYVSRAALKLKHALDFFNIKVQGKNTLDIGSSTGGFSEILLERGIHSLDCVDVGNSQLHEKISSDNRVSVFEKTDIRNFVSDKKYDLLVMDISFISQEKVLKSFSKFSKKGTLLISLIKPQFELSPQDIGKGGIVKESVDVQDIFSRLEFSYKDNGWKKIVGEIDSPILGGSGNKEYIALYEYQG